MKTRLANKLIYLILIVIAFSAGVYSINYLLVCKDINCLSVEGKGKWQIKDLYHRSKSGFKALYKSPEGMVRIEKVGNLSNTEAETFTQNRLMQIKGVFDLARSPYPGVISDQIGCSENYKPKEKIIKTSSNMNINYYLEFLNDRLQYGICLKEEIKYLGYSGIFYCPNTKEWYQLEFIISEAEKNNSTNFENIIKGVNCQRSALNMGRLLP